MQKTRVLEVSMFHYIILKEGCHKTLLSLVWFLCCEGEISLFLLWAAESGSLKELHASRSHQ